MCQTPKFTDRCYRGARRERPGHEATELSRVPGEELALGLSTPAVPQRALAETLAETPLQLIREGAVRDERCGRPSVPLPYTARSATPA